MKSYSLSHMSRHTPRRLPASHAKRGQAVRRLIIDYIATCPRPPSLREIGDAVGLSSSSTVWSHVQTLREEGKLAPAKLGQPRAILLADPGPSEVEILRERVAELERVNESLTERVAELVAERERRERASRLTIKDACARNAKLENDGMLLRGRVVKLEAENLRLRRGVFR